MGNMMSNFYFLLFGNQAKALGKTLRDLDADNKGFEDVAGNVAEQTGQAMIAFGRGDMKGHKGFMKAAADGIYTYLGYEIPTQPSIAPLTSD